MGCCSQPDWRKSVTSPGSLSCVRSRSLSSLCVSVPLPGAGPGGSGGVVRNLRNLPSPRFPLPSWCSATSQGLLTLTRALTLEPLPNGDLGAATRRVLTLAPKPVVQCSATFCKPRSSGPQAPRLSSARMGLQGVQSSFPGLGAQWVRDGDPRPTGSSASLWPVGTPHLYSPIDRRVS